MLCIDESAKQLIGDSRTPIVAKPWRAARYDYEYVRNGSCNIFIATEPLAGKRLVKVTETRKKQDWSRFQADIARTYRHAEKITLVMDNLNTHVPGSLYETYALEQAKALLDRFEFIYTPKRGSWLNMAEIKLRVLSGQCVNRRISQISEVKQEVSGWERERNNKEATINWRFTTTDSRIKLKHRYPTL